MKALFVAAALILGWLVLLALIHVHRVRPSLRRRLNAARHAERAKHAAIAVFRETRHAIRAKAAPVTPRPISRSLLILHWMRGRVLENLQTLGGETSRIS